MIDEAKTDSSTAETPRTTVKRVKWVQWARGLAVAAREASGRFGLLVLMGAMFGAFSLLRPESFPTRENVFAIAGSQAALGIAALAVMLPLIAGEFDLSVGNMLGFAAVLSIWLVGEAGIATGYAIGAVIGVGALVGLVNAFFVVGVGLSAFIATLGTATVLGGLALYVTGGEILFRGLSASFETVAQSDVGGLPVQALYFFALVLLLWYLLEYTPMGRLLTAVGLGRSAAQLAGVRTRMFVALAFVASGMLAAIAGMIEASRLGSATATAGPDYLLPAFAAAFLGATTIKRGQFNAVGTCVGVLFLAIGIVGLQQLGAPFWVSPVFNGTVLLAAVSITYIVARKSSFEE